MGILYIWIDEKELGGNASVNFRSTHSPGQLWGICLPCKSLDGAVAIFSEPQGLGICQPRGHPQVFTCTWFPTWNPNIAKNGGMYRKRLAGWCIWWYFFWIFCISLSLIKLELLQQHHKPSLYESIYRVFLGVIKQLSLCGVGIYYAVSWDMPFSDRTHPQHKETTEVFLFLNKSRVDQGFEQNMVATNIQNSWLNSWLFNYN